MKPTGNGSSNECTARPGNPETPPGRSASMKRKLRVLFCLFMAGGLWGLTPSLAKLATATGAHPLGLTLWQALGGGIVLLAITVARGRVVLVSRAHAYFYLVCGVVGTAAPTLLLFASAPHLSAGVLAIVIAAVPLLTYGIALVFRIDLASPIRILGVGLGFAAMLLIVLPGGNLNPIMSALWVLIALGIPLSYAIENVFIALRRPPGGDEISLVAGMLLASAAMLTPIVLVSDTFVPMTGPWGQVEWAILAMVFVNFITYVFFLYLVRLAGPVFASQAGYWSMVFGVLWGIVIWDETHASSVWAALGLMLLGMALVKERAVPLAAD